MDYKSPTIRNVKTISHIGYYIILYNKLLVFFYFLHLEHYFEIVFGRIKTCEYFEFSYINIYQWTKLQLLYISVKIT